MKQASKIRSIKKLTNIELNFIFGGTDRGYYTPTEEIQRRNYGKIIWLASMGCAICCAIIIGVPIGVVILEFVK